MSMSEEAKQNVWADHYEKLLNIELEEPWTPAQWTAAKRPTHPNHYLMVKRTISDAVRQMGRPIRHSGEDDQFSRRSKCHHDLRSCYRNYSKLTGSKVSLSAFIRTLVIGWCSGKRQLLRPQADKTGHEDPREAYWWLHKKGGLYWWLPSSALSQEEALQMQYSWSSRRNTQQWTSRFI